MSASLTRVVTAVVSLALLLATAAVFVPAAGAAAAVGFTITPLRHDIEVTPGGKRQKTITVTNASPKSMDFTVGIEDFVGSGSDAGASPMLIGIVPGSPISGSSWLSTDVRTFTLAANRSRTITVTAQAPADTKGGHYAAVTIGAGAIAATPQISVENRAGVLFLMNAGGVPPPELVIKRVTDTRDGGVAIDYENNGNTHASPQAEVTYVDAFGNVIKRSRVQCNETVLPGAKGRCVIERARSGVENGLPGPRSGEVRLVNDGESFVATTPTSWAGSTWSLLMPLLGIALLVLYFARIRARLAERNDTSIFE